MSNNVEPYFLTYITYYELRLVYVSSESKPYAGRGNGKYRKQQGGKHFDASKCKGWEKKKAKNVGAAVTSVPIDDLCPVVFRLTFLPAI